MSFSKHVGKEPAEDLKRRLKVVCEEAGLEVVNARTQLLRHETMQESCRVIMLQVREPGWERQVLPDWGGQESPIATTQMELRAFVGADGTWPSQIQVACTASDMFDGHIWGVPTLRDAFFTLDELVRMLPEVARQQKEIIVAHKRGERGPWRVGGLVWQEAKLGG